VDRNDWVPLGELTEGETLQAASGIATVLSLALVTCSLSVYNIEVHGEHVYEVGKLGLLVHNACHHCNPVAFGNDIPYGHKLLTNLSDAAHSKVLTAVNAFLKAEHGKTLYAGKQWWTSNVRWQDRYKTMIKFYREFDKANNTNHFASLWPSTSAYEVLQSIGKIENTNHHENTNNRKSAGWSGAVISDHTAIVGSYVFLAA
jgi:hypothetical protein